MVKYKIESVLGGIAPSNYVSGKGQYNSAISIDPDYPVGSQVKASGMIVPVAYEKFSSASITGAPMWTITNPKNSNVYTYLSDGKFFRYDSALANETALTTPTSGAGNGMTYYNNYIYLTTPTNVARYGPMDNSPSLTQTVWSTSTLGSQKLLTNTTYPTIQGTVLPNHAMFSHTDGALYLCDVSPQGQGIINKIKTSPTLAYDAQGGNFTVGLTVTGGTSGATGTIVADADAGATGTLTLSGVLGAFQDNETITDTSTGTATVNGTLVQGAGNDGSAYNVLDLPFGYFPIGISNKGTDLAIVAMQTTNADINQGECALFLWNTLDESFYRQITINDPLVTAIYNSNGAVHIFSGSSKGGLRHLVYNGADGFTELELMEECYPTSQGAVSAFHERICYGTATSYPVVTGSVFARGSRRGEFRSGTHCIAKSTATTSTPYVTSICYAQQSDGYTKPKMVIGWRDGVGYGLDKYTAASTLSSVWRSQIAVIGQRFKMLELKLNLAVAIASTTTITAKIYTDDDFTTAVKTLPTINNANYSGKKTIQFKVTDLDVIALDNFMLELTWSGTVACPVKLPISFKLDLFQDEPTG